MTEFAIEYILICIAAPLILMLFVQQDRRSRLLVLFLIFGLLAAECCYYVNTFLIENISGSPLDAALYIGPVVEECFKALPILILFLVARPSFKDSIGLAVAVGVGFATLENIIYMMAKPELTLAFVLIRGFATGIMHAMTVSLLAAALSFLTRSKVPFLLGLFGTLSVSVSLHGFYNLFVNGPGFWLYIGYFLPVCVALVFLAVIYVRKHRAKKAAV